MDVLWCWIQHICINLSLSWLTEKSLNLVLDMMWWWSYVRIIRKRNHHVYCDNLFTSVQLLKDLLACKTYCNGIIQVNKKYLPEGIHKPGRMICGTYKSYQDGSSNLVATVWQYIRILRLVSTNSNPSNVVHTNRRLGHKSATKYSTVQQIHKWCRSAWSNLPEIWCWLLLSQSMEVHPLVFCEHHFSKAN